MAAGLNIFPVHVTARTTFAGALVKRAPGANRAGRHRLRPESGRRTEPETGSSSSSARCRAAPQPCSAEHTVDDDFSQSGLEYGEFVVVASNCATRRSHRSRRMDSCHSKGRIDSETRSKEVTSFIVTPAWLQRLLRL